MKNNGIQKADPNNVEINHIKNLADSQKEWLINAKCTSSDSDSDYVKDRSKRIRNISGSPKSQSRKLGLVLKRYPKETIRSSSSSSDDEEGIVVIDRSLLYGKIVGKSNMMCTKIKNHNGGSSGMKLKTNRCDAITDNQSKKNQKYQIKIGDFSFDKSEVYLSLGDSVHFILIEADDSRFCVQHVLTGIHL